jgi:hypothetical protein
LIVKNQNQAREVQIEILNVQKEIAARVAK